MTGSTELLRATQLLFPCAASKIPDNFWVEIMCFPQNALSKSLTADPFPLAVHWKYLWWKVVVLELARSCLHISSVSHVTSYAFNEETHRGGLNQGSSASRWHSWYGCAFAVDRVILWCTACYLDICNPHWQNTSWLLSTAITTCRDCSLHRFLSSNLYSLSALQNILNFLTFNSVAIQGCKQGHSTSLASLRLGAHKTIS